MRKYLSYVTAQQFLAEQDRLSESLGDATPVLVGRVEHPAYIVAHYYLTALRARAAQLHWPAQDRVVLELRGLL